MNEIKLFLAKSTVLKSTPKLRARHPWTDTRKGEVKGWRALGSTHRWVGMGA